MARAPDAFLVRTPCALQGRVVIEQPGSPYNPLVITGITFEDKVIVLESAYLVFKNCVFKRTFFEGNMDLCKQINCKSIDSSPQVHPSRVEAMATSDNPLQFENIDFAFAHIECMGLAAVFQSCRFVHCTVFGMDKALLENCEFVSEPASFNQGPIYFWVLSGDNRIYGTIEEMGERGPNKPSVKERLRGLLQKAKDRLAVKSL